MLQRDGMGPKAVLPTLWFLAYFIAISLPTIYAYVIFLFMYNFIEIYAFMA